MRKFTIQGVSCLLTFTAIHLQSCVTAADQSKQAIGYERLFNKDNTITDEFKNIFKILSAPNVPNDLEEAFKLVQGKSYEKYTWLRTGERYDAQKVSPFTEEQADAVIAFAKDLGFFDHIDTPKNIKGILIMGSTLASMRAKVQVLNNSIENNPDLGALPLYFVGGERILSTAAGETQENLYQPKNSSAIFKDEYIKNSKQEGEQPEINDERDMTKLVVKQSLSDKFKNVYYVMADKKEGASRATTMDGMKLWFGNDNIPNNSNYAIVSSNPFILYQQLVATESSLIYKRADVKFIGYGPAVNLEGYIKEKGKIGTAQILLDNFARIIYEIQKIQKI